MPSLIYVVEAAYNVVRPQREYAYPVVRGSEIVHVDPLSSFVMRYAPDSHCAHMFIVALAFIGSRVDSQRAQGNLTIQHDAKMLCELNSKCDGKLTAEFYDQFSDPATGEQLALSGILDVLDSIPVIAWLSLDADSLRFTKSLIEFAEIVRA